MEADPRWWGIGLRAVAMMALGALAGCQTTPPVSESDSAPGAALPPPFIQLLNGPQTGVRAQVTLLPDDRVAVALGCEGCTPAVPKWLPAKPGLFNRAQTATQAFFDQPYANIPAGPCMHDAYATLLFVTAAGVRHTRTSCGDQVAPITQTLRAMINE